jgi:hypothetical protein
MPKDQVNRTEDGAGSPADLLKTAARFRRHAQQFSVDPLGKHWERYADELEARAQQLTKQDEM